ncbi:DUF378 domain-containing protein [Poriferisphaera sp. WC338]|uniref:DUF378 domain-containing protein n=1 Tax=Poriferisphaera sp. WC338 TaxID=3425129 RepID=UPI003D8137E8
MKALDVIAAILLIVGGLNWALVGLFQFDLIASVFGGEGTALARLIYILVGVAAVWQIAQFKAIQQRWGQTAASKPM